jgi:ATP-binding cassette subfamily B protein
MIKKLAGAIRQYKKASILTPVFVICEIILEVTIPLLMANLIDYGIDDGNMLYILKIGAALLISALFTILLELLQVTMRQQLVLALQRICAKICTTMYKTFHFQILISFQLQVL